MAGKRHCSLFCSPQPIARFVQLFPKLAVVFFVIHVTVIIYSFYNPSPHTVKTKDVPPGVVDNKMKSPENDYRVHTNKNASDAFILDKMKGAVSKHNHTKSLLIQKLKPHGIHGNRKDSNVQVNVHNRSVER